MTTFPNPNPDPRTAEDLAREFAAAQRYSRFAHAKGWYVAMWRNAHGEWSMIAAKAIDGRWYSAPGNVCANGEPLVRQEEWIEVTA